MFFFGFFFGGGGIRWDEKYHFSLMLLYLLTLNSSAKVYIIYINLNYLNLIRSYSIMIHYSRRLIWQQYLEHVVGNTNYISDNCYYNNNLIRRKKHLGKTKVLELIVVLVIIMKYI